MLNVFVGIYTGISSRHGALLQIGSWKPHHRASTPLWISILAISTDSSDVKRWLKRRPKHGKVVFITETGSRLELVRAYAVGATEFVNRPVDASSLIAKLCGDFKSLADATSEFQAEASSGVIAALEALQDAFASAALGTPLDFAALDRASEGL